MTPLKSHSLNFRKVCACATKCCASPLGRRGTRALSGFRPTSWLVSHARLGVGEHHNNVTVAVCFSTSIFPTFPVLHIRILFFLAHSVLNQYPPSQQIIISTLCLFVTSCSSCIHPQSGPPILLSQQFSYRKSAIVGHLSVWILLPRSSQPCATAWSHTSAATHESLMLWTANVKSSEAVALQVFGAATIVLDNARRMSVGDDITRLRNDCID